LGGEGSEFAGCGGVRRRGVGPVGGALHPPGIIRSTFKGSPDVIKWFTAAVRSGSTSGRNPPRRCSGWAIATSEGDVEIAVGHGRRSGDARATMDEERADNLTSSALKRGGIRRCGQLKPELQWASSSSYGAIRAGVSGVGPRPRVNLSIPLKETGCMGIPQFGGHSGPKRRKRRVSLIAPCRLPYSNANVTIRK